MHTSPFVKLVEVSPLGNRIRTAPFTKHSKVTFPAYILRRVPFASVSSCGVEERSARIQLRAIELRPINPRTPPLDEVRAPQSLPSHPNAIFEPQYRRFVPRMRGFRWFDPEFVVAVTKKQPVFAFHELATLSLAPTPAVPTLIETRRGFQRRIVQEVVSLFLSRQT